MRILYQYLYFSFVSYVLMNATNLLKKTSHRRFSVRMKIHESVIILTMAVTHLTEVLQRLYERKLFGARKH